jgi:hypothetical protein
MDPSGSYPPQKFEMGFDRGYGSLNRSQQVPISMKSHLIWEGRRRRAYMDGFMDQPRVPLCGSHGPCCPAANHCYSLFHSGISFNR